MTKKKKNSVEEELAGNQPENQMDVEQEEDSLNENGEETSEETDDQKEEDPLEAMKEELSESRDKYLRLYSEFENYRRRTAKEKIDLIGTASKEVIGDLLPVLDDFDRAFKSLDHQADGKLVIEGMELVIQKFQKTLKGKGLKKMEIEPGTEFDDEFHEAISLIPAPDKKLEGKIIDVVESGYFLNDKVLRFAKVVTGAKS